MMKSWKTTWAGILQFLALAATQVGFLLDADPTTMPDWGLLVASLITLVGLLTARDNDVTSEDAKAEVVDTEEAAARIQQILPEVTRTAGGTTFDKGDPHALSRKHS